MEVFEAVKPILLDLAVVLITCLGGFLSAQARKYINTKEKQAVVDATVKYVEQVFKDLHGVEKYEQAQAKIIELLNEKGISIGEAELKVLIEAAVKSLNTKE